MSDSILSPTGDATADGRVREKLASVTEPGCLRDQKQPCRDDNDPHDSRGAGRAFIAQLKRK